MEPAIGGGAIAIGGGAVIIGGAFAAGETPMGLLAKTGACSVEDGGAAESICDDANVVGPAMFDAAWLGSAIVSTANGELAAGSAKELNAALSCVAAEFVTRGTGALGGA